MSWMQSSALSCAYSHQGCPKDCVQHQGNLRNAQPAHRPNSHAPHPNLDQSMRLDARLDAGFTHSHAPTPGALRHPLYGHDNGYSHVSYRTPQNTPSILDSRSSMQLQYHAQKGNHPELAKYLNCFSISPGDRTTQQQHYAPVSATRPSMPSGMTLGYTSVAAGNNHASIAWAQCRPHDAVSSEGESRKKKSCRAEGDGRSTISKGPSIHAPDPIDDGVRKRRRHRRRVRPHPSSRKTDLSYILCDSSSNSSQLPSIQTIYEDLPSARWPEHATYNRIPTCAQTTDAPSIYLRCVVSFRLDRLAYRRAQNYRNWFSWTVF